MFVTFRPLEQQLRVLRQDKSTEQKLRRACLPCALNPAAYTTKWRMDQSLAAGLLTWLSTFRFNLILNFHGIRDELLLDLNVCA